MTDAQYVNDLFIQEDEVLMQTRAALLENKMPEISLPPYLAKLLYILVKASGAKNILEVGTLAGYSGIWLARALPAEGRLLSLERYSHFAEVARENFNRAGLQARVEIRVGEALEEMQRLQQAGETFDFFFFDADKMNLPEYLQLALSMATPGAMITADNTLWSGRVADCANAKPTTEALRQFNRMLATDPRLESIIIPAGDGLAVARVKDC